MIVKLTTPHRRYRELTPERRYAVIGIEANDLRILNDEGRPFLYPARIFTVVDRREPASWISEVGEQGERYAYPPPLGSAGFFEDFFDGNKRAVRTFWRAVNEQMAAAARRPISCTEDSPPSAGSCPTPVLMTGTA